MPSTGSEAGTRPPRVRVEVVDRLRTVDRLAFEELTSGASLMVSRPYLLAVEPDPAIEARYLLAYEGDSKLVGALPCYIWDGRPAPALDNYDPVAIGGGWVVGDRSAPSEWRPTMFVGTRSGYVNEWLIHPRARDHPARVLRPMLRAALRLGRKGGCASSAAMWLTSKAASQLTEALGPTAHLMLGAGSASLDAGFPDFETYLASLSPSRRHFVRRERARFSSSSLSVAEARLSECWEELARLAAPLQAKYGHRSSVSELEGEFRRQAEQLDSCSWVLICRRRDRPVGFTLFYRWGDTLYGRAAGFDYPEVADAAAYFNLAFYLPLEHGIRTGARSLHLGLASWHAKVMRGARLDPSWLWVVPPRRWRRSWPRLVQDQPAGVRSWLEGQVGGARGGLEGPGWERPSG